MSGPTLEDVAAARESARLRVEAAVERIGELKPLWRAAGAEHREALEELARIDLALSTAKRAHLVGAAVAALGVETSEAPVIVAQRTVGLPEVYELAALDARGAGLYLHRPPHRSGGAKAHAIRDVHVPPPVIELVDADTRGVPNDVQKARRLRLAELVGTGAEYEVRRVYGAEGLVHWQGRGAGDFGAGSGSIKPLPPPGGGRWRWLKVRDQSTLASEN